MAKVTLNSALQGIRGRIDNWVYRRFGDRMVIARRPEFTAEASPAQLAVRDKFKAAATYARNALANPVSQALYQNAARVRGTPVFAFVMGDYLNPPEVRAIDASGYHGRAGDPILVSALDNFEVVSVNVAIRDAANAVIEEGPAALAGGAWEYVATVAIPPGANVTIEAVAKDHAGQPGGKALPLLIA